MQGGLVHVGKFPKHATIEMTNKRRLETLKRRLQEEIAKENFEGAAGIRDEINQLRREMKKEGETNA